MWTSAQAQLARVARWRPASLGLRRRLRVWFEARLPQTDTVTLTQRTVYILPTGPGLMLGATLLVLLITSINYQLNLGYLLTFLLAGSALASLHVCHATLRGLTLHLIAPGPLFSGALATFSIQLSSEKRRVRHGIGVAVADAAHWAWCDVPAQGSSTVHLTFSPDRRGLHPVPTLQAQTRFPLGTFRAWTVWRPAAQVLVYPSPESPTPPLPPGEPRGHGQATQIAQASGDFDGVRPYRRGDPLKHVVWKKAAKSDTLVSRDMMASQPLVLWFELQRCGLPHPEQQLSRLCAWVLQAEARGLDYGLRLPRLDIAPAHGEAHKRRCLQALALH